MLNSTTLKKKKKNYPWRKKCEKTENQAREWEKILAMYLSDKSHLSRVNKGILLLCKRKTAHNP